MAAYQPHHAAALKSKPSKETQEKVLAMKKKVEATISGRMEDVKRRRIYTLQMQHKLKQNASIDDEKRNEIMEKYYKAESSIMRNGRKRLGLTDFTIIKTIGKGAFGEVRVVRNKQDNVIYAMKTMRKKDMIEKNQVAHVKAERDLMANAGDTSSFLVKLNFSFQDDVYLYLVMEYCGGGDLMTILMREDILSEAQSRFYMAELAVAINAVHELDFVHRDLKPDNILIANDGHIKLSDFGLAKSFNTENDAVISKYQTMKSQVCCSLKNVFLRTPISSIYIFSHFFGDDNECMIMPNGMKPCFVGIDIMFPSNSGNSFCFPIFMYFMFVFFVFQLKQQEADSNGGKKEDEMDDAAKRKKYGHKDRKLMYSTVGTPDYIAPEVFSAKGYDKMVDWWSMGVIMFECLVGYPPFYAEDPLQTCRKIVHYRKYFKIPYDAKVSKECADLVHNLVCNYRRRFSFEKIKAHSFFKKVPWNNMTAMKPPFVPSLSSEIDTSNFEQIEEEQDMASQNVSKKKTGLKKENHFISYTFQPQDFGKVDEIMKAVDGGGSMAQYSGKPLPPKPRTKPKYVSTRRLYAHSFSFSFSLSPRFSSHHDRSLPIHFRIVMFYIESIIKSKWKCAPAAIRSISIRKSISFQ